MHRIREKKEGMTLIEVLVALVILTTGVSAMMLAMSRCLAVVRTARTLNVAQSLIRQVELEQPIDNVEIEEGWESGDFEDVEGYTWDREIILVDEETRPGLFLITTRVIWSEHGRDSFEEMVMYKYAPKAKVVTSAP